MRYYFQIDCEIVKDHYTEGETDRVNHHHWRTEVIVDDNTPLQEVLLKFIETELFYNDGKIDHIQVDEEKSNRFCYSVQIESVDDITANSISTETKNRWIAGEIELYQANYDILIFKQAPVDLLSIESINTF